MQYGPDGLPVSNVSILVGPPLKNPAPVPVTTTETVIGPLIYDTADASKTAGGNIVPPEVPYAVAVADENTEVTGRVTLLNFQGNAVSATYSGGGEVIVTINTGADPTNLVAGTGIGINVSNNNSTINNTGVLQIAAGNGISVNQSTGIVTINSFSTDTVYNGGNVTGNVTPNRNQGTIQKYTLTGNINLNLPANMSTGQSLTLIFTQDNVGNRLLNANSAYLFASGFQTLSTDSGAIDMMNIFYDGTYLYSTLTVGYS